MQKGNNPWKNSFAKLSSEKKTKLAPLCTEKWVSSFFAYILTFPSGSLVGY